MVKHTSNPIDLTVPKKRAVIWKAVSSERQAHEDKVSLVEQERLAREWCNDNDFDIIRVLEVHGHSRRESDIISALEEFQRNGVYAYHDLRQMWQDKSFDVLVAYAHDRLGRSNTLHSWVIENTIMNGMSVFLLQDGGFVDMQDFRYKLAIGGMMAATPVDRLIKAAAAAKDNLILQGLPTGAKIPLSHRLIRDPQTGKAIELVLDERYTQLFEDLAELFLEGIAYNYLSQELFDRYGYARKNGKPYRHNLFYELFFTPTFWGHMARGYTSSSKNGDSRGAWVFDESAELPAGVTVARDVIPAVYTDDLADNMKSELYRRMEIGGNRRAKDTYRYAGLFVCGVCGSGMSTRSKPKRGRIGVKCSRIYSRVMDRTCSQNLMTPHRTLQAEMEILLTQLIEGINPDVFQQTENPDDEAKTLKTLRQKQLKLQQQITVLITEQSSAPEATRALYRQQIEQLSSQLERVNDKINQIQRAMDDMKQQSYDEVRTIDELKRLTLQCFWNLPDREINQWLKRLMGKRKFVIVNREIVGVVDLPVKRRNK